MLLNLDLSTFNVNPSFRFPKVNRAGVDLFPQGVMDLNGSAVFSSQYFLHYVSLETPNAQVILPMTPLDGLMAVIINAAPTCPLSVVHNGVEVVSLDPGMAWTIAYVDGAYITI